ncbi:MAG: Flp family type IVb pilin [Blastochloris sp.]|nr:Flp family type IVb pilin [Blastochloris sp.]
MTKLYVKLMNRLKSRKGQTLVEYGLILALVAIVVIAILSILGNQLQNIFGTITASLAI